MNRDTMFVAAANDGLFIIESPPRDVVKFDELPGRVTGLRLAPEFWAARSDSASRYPRPGLRGAAKLEAVADEIRS